jgi:hypothetical protein
VISRGRKGKREREAGWITGTKIQLDRRHSFGVLLHSRVTTVYKNL